MTDKPFISVVIPLYNKEKSIAQSLKSVLDQTYTNFEIVVVDDGSTDKSVEVVKDIGDEKIKLFCKENGGPGSARNYGAQHALADWLVFLDADDELLPNALVTFAEVIEKHSDVDIYDANKIILIKENKTLQYHPLEGYVKNPLKACFFSKVMPGMVVQLFERNFSCSIPTMKKSEGLRMQSC